MYTDWDKWAEIRKIKSLPHEAIEVMYDSPSSNPLDIIVVIKWQRKNAWKSLQLQTKVAR